MTAKRRRAIASITFGSLSVFGASWSLGGALEASDLRCEYFSDPIGISETSPRLSWSLASDERGAKQTAYRVLVASSLDLLDAGKGDLWDSGRVSSGANSNVAYKGSELDSREVCYWKVKSWDNSGDAGSWSEPAKWEMALLDQSDWSAEWIDGGPTTSDAKIIKATYYTVDGAIKKDVTDLVKAMVEKGEPVKASNDALGGDPKYGVQKKLLVEYDLNGTRLTTDVREDATAAFADTTHPYLRKSFELTRPVERARLYASALGMYELSLNGQRVGDNWLAPGWTDYRERVQYQVYDVTDQLADGANVLGAMTGPGWFAGRAGLFHISGFYGDRAALIAQLEVTYEDGSVETIGTDGSWERHDGPILLADIMDGEVYDAGKAIDGWSEPASRDDSDGSEGWEPVDVRREQRNLQAQLDQPIRVLTELPTIELTEPAPGRWTFDVGQNMVGVVRLRLNEKPGTVLTIKHGEMLNPDGTVYIANLRGAAATDTYICSGDPDEEWNPRFTFHGFRYVEITGLSEAPTPEMVTGIVLGTDVPEIGSFACSDERLNQLQSNIMWGLHGNFVSIPTDCPQRDERMGWTGDIQAFIPTATYNVNAANFMAKWMNDLDDAQREDGAHSDVAPVTRGLNFGTPAWGDAGTVVPWTVYEMYGDKRILENHIKSMTAWVEWCKRHSTDLIRDKDRGNDYGDWLSINADTPKDVIGTAYFAHSANLLAKSYDVLGDTQNAQRYHALFQDIRDAFNKKYLSADGTVHGDTQTAYLLSLYFDIAPDDMRDAIADKLVGKLRENGWRLSTGFIGVSMLLPVLDETGHHDEAYRLLMQDAFPSWLFSVKHGATTIWERWNGWTPETGPHPDIGMNSFNHYALGSCGSWLFGGVAGIKPGDDAGFQSFVIEPHIGGGLTWAKAIYDSTQGQIVSEWKTEDAGTTFNITIPANTEAVVSLPVGDSTKVTESGTKVEALKTIKTLGNEEGRLKMLVGSGTYSFRTLSN